MEEIWKDIVGYEGLYQVSNLGRIRSVSRFNINSLGYKRFLTGKECKQATDKDGYKRISLRKGNSYKGFMIHKLVLDTFEPCLDKTLSISHKDKNKINNVLTNLYRKRINTKLTLEKKLSKYDYISDLGVPINSIADNKECVIYKLLNTQNNKFYIGSTKNFSKRALFHIFELENNKHRNRYLQNSWNKYGSGSFKFEIVEYCAEEKRLEREQYFIDVIKPSYNLNPIATGGSQSEWFTSEIKKKMSEDQKKKWENLSEEEKNRRKSLLRSYVVGRVHTEEEKIKRKETLHRVKPWLNGKEKRRAACAASNKERFSIPVLQFDKLGNFISDYRSLIDAAHAVNLKHSSSIIACCKNKRKFAAGFIWKYKNNN